MARRSFTAKQGENLEVAFRVPFEILRVKGRGSGAGDNKMISRTLGLDFDGGSILFIILFSALNANQRLVSFTSVPSL